MKNEKVFKETVTDAANLKIKAKEECGVEYGNLKKLYAMATGKKGNSFKFFIDNLFFKGGFPKEETEPKIKDTLDKVGNVFRLYKVRGIEGSINAYLKETFGIEIKDAGVSGDSYDTEVTRKRKKFDALYQDVFGVKYKGETIKEVVNKITDLALDVQKDIYKISEEVDKNSKEAEIKCDVAKPVFVKSVDLKVTEMKKGTDEMNEKINDMNTKNTQINELVEYISDSAE